MGRISTLRKQYYFDQEGVIENEKRSNGYWIIIISSIPLQGYNEQLYQYYELMEQDWIDKLKRTNDGNKFGFCIPFLISNIEKHNYELYARPEKISPVMHIHMMIPFLNYENGKKYRDSRPPRGCGR